MNFHPSYPILLLFEPGNKTVPAPLVFVQYKKEAPLDLIFLINPNLKLI